MFFWSFFESLVEPEPRLWRKCRNALGGLDEASLTERTARLSEGISAAMVTTAWGLVVGVPALLAHGFLSSKATEILATCESYCAMRAPLPKSSTQEQGE